MSGNTPKVLIAVGVVLVVLFVAGTAIGANGGLPGLSVEGVVGALGGLLPSARVELADVTATPESCLDRTTQRLLVPQLGQCVLQIGPSSANVRTLRLTSGSALRARMTVEATEGRPLTIRAELPADPRPGLDGTPAPTNELKLDVYSSGGTLIIDQCVPASGGACVVDLS